MNFDYSEEQQLLADTLKRFLATHYTFDARTKIVASTAGYSEDMWTALADMGLLGVPFDTAYGGFGGSAVDVMVVMEAIGEGLVVEPYLATVGLGGQFVARGGRRHSSSASCQRWSRAKPSSPSPRRSGERAMICSMSPHGRAGPETVGCSTARSAP